MASAPLNSESGFSVGKAKTLVIDANGVFNGSISNANLALYANVANMANTVAGANVTGTVANANYASTSGSSATSNYANTANVANTANTVTGANIIGEVANANFATYSAWSNVANTANIANTVTAVNIANVTGITTLAQEIHVDTAGSDTSGDGSTLRPYKTITKGVNVAAGSAIKIVVHSGGYYEDVTLANITQMSVVSAATAGVSSPSTPMIYGNLTLSGNTGGIAIGGIAVSNTITHSSTGSFYYTGSQLGGSQFTGTLNKTGSGYLALKDCDFATGNGANFTSVNITGNGPVTLSNVNARNLTVNNSSVSVTVTNDSVLLNTTVTAGSLNVFDTFLYSNAANTAALTTSNGVINLKNVTALTPTNGAARLNISPTTVFAYDDIYFDRSNSNVGYSANLTSDFQSLRASNTVTATTVSASSMLVLSPLGAAPSSPVAGTFAVADRTNWDPASKGSGASYPVFYNGSSWTALY